MDDNYLINNRNMKIKIGIVIGQLSEGGAERQISALAKDLQRRTEFEPVVFCLSDNIDPHGLALVNSGVSVFFPVGDQNSLLKLIWLIKSLRNKQCRLVYGILHVGNIYGGISAFLTRLPFIASIRSANSSLPLLIKILSGLVCSRANMIVANSNSCVESLRKHLHVHHRRVRVILNMVRGLETNVEVIEAIKQQLGIEPQSKVIGTVSLLKPEKRIDFFLEIFKVVYNRQSVKSNKNIHFIWVGDGVERKKLPMLINGFSKQMLKYLHFVGAKDDIGNWLEFMDIFILTSAYEGMPNALLEAMAAGLPCIATNVPGTKDILSVKKDGELVGILASASSSELFADELIGLLNDPTRIKKIGANAKEFINENYSSKKMLNEHLLIFRAILKSE